MSIRDVQRELRERELTEETRRSKPKINNMSEYSTSELEKILIEAMHEGIRFGRELESYEDKDSLTPAAIHTTVKWRVKEMLNQNKDE